MLEELEIKNEEPSFRRMLSDYKTMLTGKNLRFNLIWLGVIIALGLIYYFGPSTIDNNTFIFLRILMFLNNSFLFVWCAMFLFAVMSPFLARLLLPLIIGCLGIIEVFIHGIRYFIDKLLIEQIESSFLYPEHEKNEKAVDRK